MAKKSRYSAKASAHISRRMHQFGKGQMHATVKGTGPVVTKPSQAIAIAMSEARSKGMKVPKARKGR